MLLDPSTKSETHIRSDMKLDQAVAKLLDIDPSRTTVSSSGGGGCSSASTWKIEISKDDGSVKAYFMKTGRSYAAEVMFEGEHASLAAIHSVVPSLCPNSYGFGALKSTLSEYFLVTDFLDFAGLSSKSQVTRRKDTDSLASKLAKLHTTPAPIPQEHRKPMFGFPVKTCCGDTAQDNSFTETWSDFYANHRLRFIGKQCQRNGSDAELDRMIETTASVVVPRLLREGHLGAQNGIKPVIVHGDLWSGNHGKATIGANNTLEEVVYDPSACYAHNEYELGIMKMFGGFGESFLAEYHQLCPKTEPVDEYDDRVALYEL